MDGTLARKALNPSRAHEERRLLLETVAMAAGFRLQLTLPDGRRPDVLRLHMHGSSVFLGEAKHTEGPNDLRSCDRLRHYVDWLNRFRDRRGVLLAVAHPRGLGDRWRDQVAWLCEEFGLQESVRSRVLTLTTTVTYLASCPLVSATTNWAKRGQHAVMTARSQGSACGAAMGDCVHMEVEAPVRTNDSREVSVD